MENKVYKILSLFSGGGFLDIGFINQGFQVEEAIEINPYFIQAYNYGLNSYFKHSNNHFVKNKIVKHKSIQKGIDASDVNEHKRLKDTYKGIFGIIGGPPCQDYSVGGKNVGIEGEKGRLIYSYFEIVKGVKPSFLFFENVEGLYRTKRHREAFDLFVKKIEDLGYVVWHDILNVLEYGHPQDRPRIALVAFKKNIISTIAKKGYLVEKSNLKLKTNQCENFVFKWPTPKYKFPKKYTWPTKSKFGGIDLGFKESPAFDLCVQHVFSDLTLDSPNQKEYFKPRSERFLSVEEGDTNRKSFKRLHRYRYSPTVAYGNNEVHLHPFEARRLSVRESLRLQTVPDEYILPIEMPLTPKFKLISNGVPTAIAELISKEIRRTLTLFTECGGYLE